MAESLEFLVRFDIEVNEGAEAYVSVMPAYAVDVGLDVLERLRPCGSDVQVLWIDPWTGGQGTREMRYDVVTGAEA